MFNTKIYIERRKKLKELVGSGIIFFPGAVETPMSYPDNTFPFRQDSSFLYYFGLDIPDVSAIIDVDNDKEIIFGNDRSVDDVIWMGPEKPMTEKAAMVGVSNTEPTANLDKFFVKAIKSGKRVHYLPQHQAEIKMQFESLLGICPTKVNQYVSEKLIRSVIEQRSVKSDEEISEIEKALNISYEMNSLAFKFTKPGTYEREVYGAVEGIALSMGSGISFPVIFSIHGETLHNHYHDNLLKEGNIVVMDSGAESFLHYASDITRTIPVSGNFTGKQKDIYNIVLNSQLKAIEKIKPGITNKEVHLTAAKTMVDGLKELGLMKGSTDEAAANGAHALFFPHGLGHMMGLDVHDMEGLGENYVGYNDEIKRSEQFGLAYLRLAKKLKPGFVFTVEPGIYFIPQLIDIWKAEKKLSDFINYDKVEEYRNFGGIRIEDDVLVTNEGCRVLGKPIPKTVEDVEAAWKV